MKALLNFPDSSEYNSFYNNVPISDIGGNYYKPNIVSFCKTNKEIHYNKKEHIIPIEYLKSTGIQHINTGYIPNANTQLYIEFSVVSYNTNMSNATTPFGARMAWQNKQFVLFCPVNNVKQSVVCYGNVAQSNTNTTINLNQKYICDVNKTVWVLKHSNGTNIISKTFTATDTSNLPNLNLYLFNLNQNNVISTTNDILNIYKCTIKENGTLIRDMIPVRVGQVGYMYDKVFGQLFGNSGSGSFILGPDL